MRKEDMWTTEKRLRKEDKEKKREREGGREGGREREKVRTERWCWPLHRERSGWSHLSRSRWSDATEKETPPRPGQRSGRVSNSFVRIRSFLNAVCPKTLSDVYRESSSAMHHSRFCHRRSDKRCARNPGD